MQFPGGIDKVTTPLILGGLAVFLFFYILRFVITKYKGRLQERDLFKLLMRIVDLGFRLALVSTVLGFFGYVLVLVLEHWVHNQPSDPRDRTCEINPEREPEQTELRVVIQNCAKQVDLVTAIGPGLDGNLRLSTKKGTLRAIMNEICELKGCDWDIKPGNPPVLFVNPRSNPPHPE
jgi:hypothetical protein